MNSINQEVTVMGWVRTFRNNQFIALNDGSTNNNFQVVVELGKFDDDSVKTNYDWCFIKSNGNFGASLGKDKKWN